MTLSDLADIGEILGGVAVLASLLYLAVQLRQNTRATQASARQAVARDWVSITDMVTQDPELTRIWFDGLKSFVELTPADRRRFNMIMASWFRRLEGIVLETGKGTLEIDDWRLQFQSIRTALAEGGCSEWWYQFQDTFTPEFKKFVNQHLLDTVPPSNQAGAISQLAE